jgi:hypothetical protein
MTNDTYPSISVAHLELTVWSALDHNDQADCLHLSLPMGRCRDTVYRKSGFWVSLIVSLSKSRLHGH